MIILGIDPGTAITGYGLIKVTGNKQFLLDYGCIRTAAHTPLPERLNIIYNSVCRILDETCPDQLAVEQLFFNTNTTTALSVGHARGVLILAASQRKIPIAEYTPLQIKQAVTGYGHADKKQIQYMVSKLLNMEKPPRPDDAADALAVAISHAHYYMTRRLRGEEEKL